MLGWVGGADDKYFTLVVKMVYGWPAGYRTRPGIYHILITSDTV